MPFWRAYYHLVWATKDRAELIGPEVEETLFRYLVNKAAELNVRVYAINGWFDHVHMVVAAFQAIDVKQGLIGSI
jgi:putative transposase